MIPDLLTPEEVAEKLKVTRRTVYQWLLTGQLHGLKAGDKWRVTESDLMAFLQRESPAKSTSAPKKRTQKSTSNKRSTRK